MTQRLDGLNGPDDVRAAFVAKFPWLARDIDRMLDRGRRAERGGLVVVDSANRDELKAVYASMTGNSAALLEHALGQKARLNALGLYSALADGVSGVNANALTAEGWRQQVQGMVSKGRVKADEVEWSGLVEWLDLQGPAKIPKTQVQAFLDSHGVQVDEEVLTAPARYAVCDSNGRVYRRFSDVFEADAYAHDLNLDPENLVPFTVEEVEPNPLTETYDDYVLPGGTNYRALILTLPVTWTGDASTHGVLPYKSRHWPQHNVLAHIRLNDRLDVDGRRVLFIEEIQSDWGQEGRRNGFGTQEILVHHLKDSDPDQDDDTYEVVVGRRRIGFVHALNETDALAKAKRAFGESPLGQGVPRAPFVTTTDAWLRLTLKRVITLAVSQGYDKVAFVTGQQSVDRYQLSKAVSDIQYRKVGDDAYYIVTGGPGGGVHSGTHPASELERYIGKNLAQHVVERASEQLQGLDGLDLRIGGAGMKVFYDEIVPNAVKQLVGRLGGTVDGVKVAGAHSYEQMVAAGQRAGLSQRELDAMPVTKRKALIDSLLPAQPGFTITDVMRSRVTTQGLPLFSRVAQYNTRAPEFKAWFGDYERDPISASKIVDANGEPMVVYHGGLRWDVVDMDLHAGGRGALWASEEFTTAVTYADQYKTSESEIKPLYLRMVRPLDLRNDDVRNTVWPDEWIRDRDVLHDRQRIDQAIAYAKANGFDGVIHPDTTSENHAGGTSFVVFDQRQVRLARPTGLESQWNSRGHRLRDDPAGVAPADGVAFPRAGAVVDGRRVRDHVPNLASIRSSLDEHTILKGVREVPLSAFTLTGKSYSVSETNRIATLAEQIRQSGEINPLIVVMDGEGPYILEGAHRAEALFLLGAKSFPAVVVRDDADDSTMVDRDERAQESVDETTASNDVAFFDDIPSEAWLATKLAQVLEDGRNKWGVPRYMGPVTGRFSRNLNLPVALLATVPGERGEQSDVRQQSLDHIRSNWDSLMPSHPPYIEVDPFGKAWVNEGNHRIMVAVEMGLEYIPVEVRYFTGGQIHAKEFAPDQLMRLDAAASRDTGPVGKQQTRMVSGSVPVEGKRELARLSPKVERALCIQYVQPFWDAAPESMKSDFDAACAALEWRIATIDKAGFTALGVHADDVLHGLDPDQSDLDRPIVFSVDTETPWHLWDGVHRIFSARAKGRAQLPAVVGLMPGAPVPPWLMLETSKVAVDKIRESNFQQWFNGSKVVDSDGKPLVVYHGTTQDFTVFESRERYPTDKLYVDGTYVPKANGWDMGDDRRGHPESIHYGAWTDVLTMGVESAIQFREEEAAHWKSQDPDTHRHLADLRRLRGRSIEWRKGQERTGDAYYFSPAATYSQSFSVSRALGGVEGGADGGNMMPVYLDIKNPIYLDAGAIEVAGVQHNVERYMAQGYDGAIYQPPAMFGGGRVPLEKDMGSNSAQIVAFRPEQIKSAIGNAGTFDRANADILASRVDALLQGFYDPGSGLTFIVAPNVTAETVPAVVLHEIAHSQQRASLDAQAKALLDQCDRIDSLVPPETRAFLARVRDRLKKVGDAHVDKEILPYIVEQAVTEGRRRGFSVVDGKFMDWVDRTLGLRVGELIRSVVALVRAAFMRCGIQLEPGVDDLVALTKLGVHDAAAGHVAQVSGVMMSRQHTGEKGAQWNSKGPCGLYSALEKCVDSLATQSAEASGWKEIFRGMVKRGLVKADELAWSGLDDWLEVVSSRKHAKPILQAFRNHPSIVELRNQGVTIDCTASAAHTIDIHSIVVDKSMRGRGLGSKALSILTGMADAGGIRLELEVGHDEEGVGLVDWYTRHGFTWQDAFMAREPRWNSRITKEQIQQFVHQNGVRVNVVVRTNEKDGDDGDDEVDCATVYRRYVSPGAENYREVLLTLAMPSQDNEVPPGYRLIDTAQEARAEGLAVAADEQGPWRFTGPTMSSKYYKSREEAVAALQREAESERVNGLGIGLYKSAHWAEQDVIAHIRLADRVERITMPLSEKESQQMEYRARCLQRMQELKDRVTTLGAEIRALHSANWVNALGKYQPLVDRGEMTKAAMIERVMKELPTSYPQSAEQQRLREEWTQLSSALPPVVEPHEQVLRVLFVEEIQSDWGQDGRKFGFEGRDWSEIELELSKTVRERSRLLNQVEAISNCPSPSLSHQISELRAAIEQLSERAEHLNSELRDSVNKRRIPAAPFVSKQQYVVDRNDAAQDIEPATGAAVRVYESEAEASAVAAKVGGEVRKLSARAHTQGWLGLALRQTLLIAVKEGYDKVAFIDGNATVARYCHGDGVQHPLAGADGLRTFYDEIVPNAARRLACKLGGQIGDVVLDVGQSRDECAAQVYGCGTRYVNLPLGAKQRVDDMLRATAIKQDAIIVTPAMRDRINRDGLPLFSVAMPQPAPRADSAQTASAVQTVRCAYRGC